MRLSTAALGLTFVVTVFFMLPAAFIALNSALGLPRFQSPMLQGLGWILIACGIAVAVWASSLFRRVGLGTPVPIEPPVKLVETGLYRYSRNPIYLADLAILLGIFLARGHVGLLLYFVLAFAFLHYWIVKREEPALSARFGENWLRYAQRVPRWLGNGRPPEGAGR